MYKLICKWKEDEMGIWHTECLNDFEFTTGAPADNKFEYCPFCGKGIEAIEFKPSGEDSP